MFVLIELNLKRKQQGQFTGTTACQGQQEGERHTEQSLSTVRARRSSCGGVRRTGISSTNSKSVESELQYCLTICNTSDCDAASSGQHTLLISRTECSGTVRHLNVI